MISGPSNAANQNNNISSRLPGRRQFNNDIRLRDKYLEDKVTIGKTGKGGKKNEIETVMPDGLNRRKIFGLSIDTSQEKLHDYSEKALILKESTTLLSLSIKTLPYLTAIGAAGAFGLTAVSVAGLAMSDKPSERVDHAASAGWGIQSGLQMSARALNAGKVLTGLTVGLGVAGGILETGLGVKRIIDGIKAKDKQKLTLGILDITTGVTWALSSALIPPPFGPMLFIGAAMTKMGYMHRHALKGTAKQAASKVKNWFLDKVGNKRKNSILSDIATTPAT